jgi:hypothetical protein
MKRKWLAVGIILLFVGTSTLPVIAKNIEKMSLEKKLDGTDTQQPTKNLHRDICLSLWIGIISDVKHQGGWTPTIRFHAIYVIVLCNEYPYKMIYKDEYTQIPEEYGWIGGVGKSIICIIADF